MNQNKLEYENEAQELVNYLKDIYNNHYETVHGMLDLVIDDGSDVRKLLTFIKTKSKDPSKVSDYAMELYDAHGYEDD